jgi:hypothetical protein
MLFLENYEMLGVIWQTLSHLPSCFMCSFFSLLPAWATWRRGHHYWIIFKHKVKWTPWRSFIFPSPLSNIPKNHCASPKLCISIPSGRYPHCEPYEQNYPCFLSPFNPVNLSWAQCQIVKVQALESIKDFFKHKDSSRLHFGHRWLTHFGCANGFSKLYHAFLGWGLISRCGAYWWFFSYGKHTSYFGHFVFMCHSSTFLFHSNSISFSSFMFFSVGFNKRVM